MSADAEDAGVQFKRLAQQMGRLDKELSKRLRTKVRDLAKPLVGLVQAKVAPFSKHVAKSVTLQVAPTAKGGAKVAIYAKQSKMPAGMRPLPALLEGRRGARFRHPVFGNRNAWVDQPAHPFLEVTLLPQMDRVQRELGDTLDEAANTLLEASSRSNTTAIRLNV